MGEEVGCEERAVVGGRDLVWGDGHRGGWRDSWGRLPHRLVMGLRFCLQARRYHQQGRKHLTSEMPEPTVRVFPLTKTTTLRVSIFPDSSRDW